MNLSEINIRPINGMSGHLGFCSFVLNKELKFNNIGIYSKKDNSGLRLVFPAMNNGQQAVFPISKKLGDFLTEEIQKAYLDFIKN